MSNFQKFLQYMGKTLMSDPEAAKPDVMQPDGEGQEIAYKMMDGKCIPCIPGIKKILSELPDLPIRVDDVMINAFPKSGTNWMWEVCSMIVKKSSEPLNGMKLEGFLEALPQWLLESYDSPRLINTHIMPNCLPKQILEKNPKLILVLRNPKDVALSLYHHTKLIPLYHYNNGTFKGYFEVFITGKNDWGSWFDYMLAWDKFLQNYPKDRQLILYYEDLKEDLPMCVRVIAKYLNVDIDDALVNAIADQCGFQKMREAKKNFLQSNPVPTPGIPKDSEDTMHDIFRKGVVGDWKNNFTVAQSERVDAMYKAKMGECSFKFRYEL